MKKYHPLSALWFVESIILMSLSVWGSSSSLEYLLYLAAVELVDGGGPVPAVGLQQPPDQSEVRIVVTWPLSANHSSPDRVQVRLPRGLDQGHAAHLRGLVLAVQRHGLLSLPALDKINNMLKNISLWSYSWVLVATLNISQLILRYKQSES